MGNAQALPPPPKEMKRLILTVPTEDDDYSNAKLEVETVPVPVPRSGQVLVKMAAAPLNPSDYGEFKISPNGKYPRPVGKEGAGYVIASGGGVMANRMVGKKVGIINQDKKQGTFSEYVVASAMTSVFTLDDAVSVEDGCSFFVNPFTVIGLIESAQALGSPAFIHTAAASQLGQMMVRLNALNIMPKPFTVVNVVRRQEQAEILKKLGAEHIVVSSDADWEAQLSAKIKDLDIKVALDAVAGPMTGTLMTLLPRGGTCLVYGGLGGPISGIRAVHLIYLKKKLGGFFLTDWLKQGGTIAMGRRAVGTMATVNKGLSPPAGSEAAWSRSTFKDCALEEVRDQFIEMMHGGKGFTGTKLRCRMGVWGAEEAGAAGAAAGKSEAATECTEREDRTKGEAKEQ